MENQHKLIATYRDLTVSEIELINRIKQMEREVMALHREVLSRLVDIKSAVVSSDDTDEIQRFTEAEPLRWASIAKTELQQGFMALVRAVAQPTN